MISILTAGLRGLNELLTAGIAITAFSLLLYALTFNLRDRVARSFAFILICLVIIFVADAIGSTSSASYAIYFWLRVQWVGIIFLPTAYLHFSDALLATTGRPSRGTRRWGIRLNYLVAFFFLSALILNWLVGALVTDDTSVPYLHRTALTWVFLVFYAVSMTLAWINFWRARLRTVTSTSRRRMEYLILGSIAPALGSFPYLLFSPWIAEEHPFIFWLLAVISNLAVAVLMVVMAYSVAFFGVSWPDRVVKRRLFKWLMRGPATAIIVLGVTTLVRRLGVSLGLPYTAAVPIVMVASLLLMEYSITLAAPIWERWLFHGGDQAKMSLLQTLEERLLTSGDLHQLIEALLAAVCDQLQVKRAFVVTVAAEGLELMVSIGGPVSLQEGLGQGIQEVVDQNGAGSELFAWGDFWLLPLFIDSDEGNRLIGLLGIDHLEDQHLEPEQIHSLVDLGQRTAAALSDSLRQQQVFTSLEELTPEMDRLQRIRAAARYDRTGVMRDPDLTLEQGKISRWVKDALTHYWGGPKLTESPLIRLQIVQQALSEHQDKPANALRSILRQAIEKVRPEGERRFTGEWILYNILEMKFMEGRKVREVALRLAMSEPDLYRKQRVAIEAVANAILEMEQKAREESGNHKEKNNTQLEISDILR